MSDGEPGSGTGPEGSPCFFCARAAPERSLEERSVYEDELLLATHEIDGDGPSPLGSLLVQTRRHTVGWAGLTDAEAEGIGRLVARLSRGLVETVGAAWTYEYSFGEAFRHVHVFVEARYPALPPEYVRLRLHAWPEAPRGDRDAVHDLVGRLRAHPITRPNPHL